MLDGERTTSGHNETHSRCEVFQEHLPRHESRTASWTVFSDRYIVSRMTSRWDATARLLQEWTDGQGPSERLAVQILLHAGYTDIDPSHPLGGRDGGKDAICKRDNEDWIMAVYFPTGQKSIKEIKKKFLADCKGVIKNSKSRIVFVTNQALTLSERENLIKSANLIDVDIFHLERITTILDDPKMANIRQQFLGIDFEHISKVVNQSTNKILDSQKHLEYLQTGGDSFCYLTLYHFDMSSSVAQNFTIIREGSYTLFDLRIRIVDMDENKDIFNRQWGEMSAPAEYELAKWLLRPSVYYRVFFSARNGMWNQDLLLRKSDSDQCWLAATRVLGKNGREVIFQHMDNGFIENFGEPSWRE